MRHIRSWSGMPERVLITGGSSGIGKQLAEDFLRRGAHVTIVSNDASKLQSARSELAAIAPSICALACDVAELAEVRRLAHEYLRDFGPPDVLVSNAGFAVYRLFAEMASEEIVRLVNVNFLGGCLITREFLPAMVAAGRGDVVVMASIAGRLVMTPCGVYSAAKHGLVAWAHTLKLELKRTGVRIHVICPGRVETNFFSNESFVQRERRTETRFTIPVETVSHATMAAIKKNRFMTYVPGSYGLLVWLAHSLPFPVRVLLDRLMEARVRSMCLGQEREIQ
jgi:short-subunit dehydrogenase